MKPVNLYTSEFIGTFLLVFIGCGAVLTDANQYSNLTPVGVSLSFGLVVMAMIYSVGHICAAHFNPAVTLGFALTRRFPLRHVLPYWTAQFLGAISASAIHLLVYGPAARTASFGATVPKKGIGQAFVLEVILTFCLMWVIIAVATDRRVAPGFAGLAIGMTVAACAMMGGGISGASMNPARSLGPALLSGGEALGNLWIYFLAPPLGAAAATLLYERVRGGEEFACPTLQNLSEVAEKEGIPGCSQAGQTPNATI